MCLYMIKKGYIKITKKGDIMTRFWYNLKNLDPTYMYHFEFFALIFHKLLTIAHLSIKLHSYLVLLGSIQVSIV
jgi:hypothetical protein